MSSTELVQQSHLPLLRVWDKDCRLLWAGNSWDDYRASVGYNDDEQFITVDHAARRWSGRIDQDRAYRMAVAEAGRRYFRDQLKADEGEG